MGQSVAGLISATGIAKHAPFAQPGTATADELSESQLRFYDRGPDEAGRAHMTFGRAGIGENRDDPARALPGSGRGAAEASAALPATEIAWVRAVFVLFVIGCLMRIFLVDVIVNQFWPYTAEGGAFPAKIHPGSYLMIAACGLLYLSPGFRFAGRELPVLRAFILFAAGSAVAALVPMLQGRNGPAGYVIDVYLVICAACVFLLAMPPVWRQKAGLIIIGGLALNTLVSVGEFATSRYVLPVEAAEFRPTGFLGAALNVGVINLTACIFLISLPLHWVWKYGLTGLLMLGVLISASRTAMIVSLAVLPLSVLITARLRNSGPSMGVSFIMLLIFAIMLAPLIYFGVSELGFLDRFKSGYIDDSAQTRIDIYRVFEFVSWRDIVMGTDILRIRKIAQELLGIELIESAIVFFVFDFGLLGTFIFASMLLWLLWQLARRSHPVIGLGLLVFLVLALTNNTLSTKVPSTFAAIVLAVALGAFHGDRSRS